MGGILRTPEGGIDYGPDFCHRPIFLNVSGQMQAECYACALSNVYTFGPAFRLACHILSWICCYTIQRQWSISICRHQSFLSAVITQCCACGSSGSMTYVQGAASQRE